MFVDVSDGVGEREVVKGTEWEGDELLWAEDVMRFLSHNSQTRLHRNHEEKVEAIMHKTQVRVPEFLLH